MAEKCSKRLASFQQEGSPLRHLHIFVVGTHKDNLIKQGRLDKATQDIVYNFPGGIAWIGNHVIAPLNGIL